MGDSSPEARATETAASRVLPAWNWGTTDWRDKCAKAAPFHPPNRALSGKSLPSISLVKGREKYETEL
jgi:hypothetical protein